MNTYDKIKTIKLNGEIYKIDAWDSAGYINSRGVNIEHVISKNGKDFDGVLLRFNHFNKGESGQREYMNNGLYKDIASNYNPYDDLNTWVMPFLNYINK